MSVLVGGGSMTGMTRTQQVSAAAGTLAAVGYAVLKGAWGAGATLGVEDVEALHDAFGGHEGLATWGTVLPAVLAVVVLWWRASGRGAQRVARGLCWAGALVLVVPATLGLGEALLVVAGVLDDAPGSPLAPGVFLFVYGCFAVLVVAFVVLARRQAPGRTSPAS